MNKFLKLIACTAIATIVNITVYYALQSTNMHAEIRSTSYNTCMERSIKSLENEFKSAELMLRTCRYYADEMVMAHQYKN